MTKFVGILNITPDSFFDGGKYEHSENALKQLQILLESGVDIVDVGAESTRPGARVIGIDEEWIRLQNILPEVIKKVHEFNQKNHKKIEISLDSRYFENVRKALEMGVDIINDVSGFEDFRMIELAASSGKKIILMHNLGVPADKNKVIDDNSDVVAIVLDWAFERLARLLKSGVKKEQIIFDVGVGFGKTARGSIKLLQEIERFRILELPLYVGHSNKSFLDEWAIEGCNNREEKTNFVSKCLVEKGVEYLRVHNL